MAFSGTPALLRYQLFSAVVMEEMVTATSHSSCKLLFAFGHMLTTMPQRWKATAWGGGVVSGCGRPCQWRAGNSSQDVPLYVCRAKPPSASCRSCHKTRGCGAAVSAGVSEFISGLSRQVFLLFVCLSLICSISGLQHDIYVTKRS